MGHGEQQMNQSELDELESLALRALIKQAAEGNAQAARGALAEVDRVRKTRMAEAHRDMMASLSNDGKGMARYLGELGAQWVEFEIHTGRPGTEEEEGAYIMGQEDRMLEVRAIELARMRRGDGDVPRWAGRKMGGPR